MNTLDPSHRDFLQHVVHLEINHEDLQRKHKLLEGRFAQLEKSYFAESGDRMLTFNEFRTGIASLATAQGIKGHLEAMCEGIGKAFHETTRSLKTAPGNNDSDAMNRCNALEAVVRRLEASNEHLLREVKLLHVLQKTPAGKFDAAVKARAAVMAKAKSGKGSKARKDIVVRASDAAIAAVRTSKTNRTVRHA